MKAVLPSAERTTSLAYGTVSIHAETGVWTYVPYTNYNGPDSFTVTVTDDGGGSTTQNVQRIISPVPDPAVITGDTSATGEEDTTITGTLSATDADGLTDGTYFSIESGDASANGTVSINETVNGLKVELYEGKNFDTLRSTNYESIININDQYDVGKGGNGDTFSVRATGQIQAYATGSNTWKVRSDDGVRIWIDDVQVLNRSFVCCG